MTALLSLLLPALTPALADGMKGLFQKFFGGSKPISTDDQVKLMQAEAEKLKAVAELDRPVGNPSQWVVDLRASFRYIAAGAIILGTISLTGGFFAATYLQPEYAQAAALIALLELFAQMSASVFSFMFGDRVYLGLKNAIGK